MSLPVAFRPYQGLRQAVQNEYSHILYNKSVERLRSISKRVQTSELIGLHKKYCPRARIHHTTYLHFLKFQEALNVMTLTLTGGAV